MDRSFATRILAPEVGFEPTTNRLTADRSTTELLWNWVRQLWGLHVAHTFRVGKSLKHSQGPEQTA